MNCNNNGRTVQDFLTPVLGGTAADATYLVGLTYYTCGNRKLCVSEVYQPTANLQAKVLGVPQSVGNGTYACEVLLTGQVTYVPYACNCPCAPCPRTENVYTVISVPCSSAAVPTVTLETAVASPTNVQPCCSITNAIAVTTSLNVATGA